MYAIFEDGSRQYRVSVGETVTVDYRGGEDGEGAAKGTTLEFSNVLLVANGGDLKIGQPTLAGAKVVGEVVDHPSVKTYIGKFRRRKNYRRLRGHRQHHTMVKVTEIVGG
jgi:large subunit ribosomal protein L21